MKGVFEYKPEDHVPMYGSVESVEYKPKDYVPMYGSVEVTPRKLDRVANAQFFTGVCVFLSGIFCFVFVCSFVKIPITVADLFCLVVSVGLMVGGVGTVVIR